MVGSCRGEARAAHRDDAVDIERQVEARQHEAQAQGLADRRLKDLFGEVQPVDLGNVAEGAQRVHGAVQGRLPLVEQVGVAGKRREEVAEIGDAQRVRAVRQDA